MRCNPDQNRFAVKVMTQAPVPFSGPGFCEILICKVSSIFIICHIYVLYVRVCAYTHVIGYLWRSEDKLEESDKDRTQRVINSGQH